jgi:hypothetical protein
MRRELHRQEISISRILATGLSQWSAVSPDEVDGMLSVAKRAAGLDHDLARLPFSRSEKLLDSRLVGIRGIGSADAVCTCEF